MGLRQAAPHSIRSMPLNREIGPGAGEAFERVDVGQWAQAERLRLVFRNLPVTLAVSVACACILAGLLRQTVRPLPLLGWAAAGVLISCLRYRGYRQFRRAGEPLDTHRWGRLLTLGTGASGLFWGSSAVVLFPPGDLSHQVLIVFVLAGVSAGAMTSYAAVRRCYFAFVLPTVIPVAVRMAMEPTEINHGMAFLTLLFLGVVIRAAIETDRTIGSILSARAENARLLQELRHQATHDALVDLPNQREFHSRLYRAAASKSRVYTNR